jgi:F-type H+-transporting ATPase subunit b
MLIDWPTVIFQIINFLILIALLKRFLYGPIIRAMDEREKKIAQSLAQAAKAEKEAAAHASLLATEHEEFASKRVIMQQEARREIDTWKNGSIDRLKIDVADQKKNWQKNLENEKEAFLQKLKISISQQVFQVARKAFTDLADEQLEIRLIDTFLEKIDQELASIEKQNTAHETVRIISGFPLHQTEKDRLQQGLTSFFPKQEIFHFQEEPELGFGLRLLAGNHKWEWNLNRYMLDIEDEILKTMGMTK